MHCRMFLPRGKAARPAASLGLGRSVRGTRRIACRDRFRLLAGGLVACCCIVSARADDPADLHYGWQYLEEADGRVFQRVIEITPRAIPAPSVLGRPGRRVRTVPDGNAALYYLRAAGFVGRDYDRTNYLKRLQDARKQTPNAWIASRLPQWWCFVPFDTFPAKQVEQILEPAAFQTRWWKQAVQQRNCWFGDHARLGTDPRGAPTTYLFGLREMATLHALRYRMALHRGQLDKARRLLEDLRVFQQHAVQYDRPAARWLRDWVDRHVEQATWDMIGHPAGESQYWQLLARLPMLSAGRSSSSASTDVIPTGCRELMAVDLNPRPAAYWHTFIRRLSAELQRSSRGLRIGRLPSDDDLAAARIVALIAANYPDARAYLIREEHISPEVIDRCPTAQVVLFAVRRIFERFHRTCRAIEVLPLDEARQQNDRLMQEFYWKDHWKSAVASLFEYDVTIRRRVEAAQTAVLQVAVEVLRDELASKGKFPPRLDGTKFPVPKDPATGARLEYRIVNGRAVLSAPRLWGAVRRVVVAAREEMK